MDSSNKKQKPSDSTTQDSLKLSLEHYSNIEEENDCDKEGTRLDLILEGYDSTQPQLNQELNLIDSLDASYKESTSEEQKLFSCNYCLRTFYSSQALGGHQNAHKRERTLAKRGQKMTAFGHIPYDYAPVSFHGRYSNRSLGIQAHSMTHKPSSYNGFGGEYCQNNWSRIPFVQQPAIGKLPSNHYNHHQMMIGPPLTSNISRSSVERTLLNPAEEEYQKNLDLSLKL